MPRRWTHRAESAFCLLIVLAVPLIAFLPIIRDGAWPWSPAPLRDLAPWAEAQVAPNVTPSPFDTDFVHRYLPWYTFIAESAATGQSVLWNPYEGGGVPFFAAWVTRCLSPFTLPVYLLPLAQALAASVLAKSMIAGVCALLAARRLGMVWPAALFAAVVYETAPVFLLWSAAPIADAAPWFPLAVLAIEEIRHRYWAGTLLLAAVFTLILLGGAPASALYLAFLALWYGVFMAIRSGAPRSALRHGTGVAAATVLALGLSAVQWIPASELLPLLAPLQPDAFYPSLSLAGMGTLFILPAADGPAGGNLQLSVLLHIGLTALLLAPLWFAVRPFLPRAQRNALESYFATAIVLTTVWLFAYAMIPHNRISAFATPEHALAILPFLVALCAAAAVQEWSALDAQETKSALRRLAVVLPIEALVLAGVLLSPLMKTAGLPWWLQATLILAPFVGLVVLLGWTLLRPSIRILGYGVTALAATVTLCAIAPLQHFSRPETFFPDTAFLSTLAERGGRISGTSALKDWPLSLTGTAQLYNPTGIQLERQRSFLEAAAADPLLMRRCGSQSLLLTREDISESFAAVRPNLRIDHVFDAGAILFNDLAMSSRARMAYDPPVLADGLSPERLHAADPPLAENPVPPGEGTGPYAVPQIAQDEQHTRISIAIPDTRPGILIVADAFYPGWHARVNGKAAEIYPIDLMFRGITLGQGPQEVVLYYAPRSVLIGGAVSLTTLAVTLVLWAGALARRRGSR